MSGERDPAMHHTYKKLYGVDWVDEILKTAPKDRVAASGDGLTDEIRGILIGFAAVLRERKDWCDFITLEHAEREIRELLDRRQGAPREPLAPMYLVAKRYGQLGPPHSGGPIWEVQCALGHRFDVHTENTDVAQCPSCGQSCPILRVLLDARRVAP